MEPETLAAFPLGNAEYIDLVTAKHKEVHKTWKNHINANNKKRKAETNSTSPSDIANAVNFG